MFLLCNWYVCFLFLSNENGLFSHKFICAFFVAVGPGMQSASSQIHSTNGCNSWEIPWSLDLWFCGWQVWFQKYFNYFVIELSMKWKHNVSPLLPLALHALNFCIFFWYVATESFAVQVGSQKEHHNILCHVHHSWSSGSIRTTLPCLLYCPSCTWHG